MKIIIGLTCILVAVTMAVPIEEINGVSDTKSDTTKLSPIDATELSGSNAESSVRQARGLFRRPKVQVGIVNIGGGGYPGGRFIFFLLINLVLMRKLI